MAYQDEDFYATRYGGDEFGERINDARASSDDLTDAADTEMDDASVERVKPVEEDEFRETLESPETEDQLTDPNLQRAAEQDYLDDDDRMAA